MLDAGLREHTLRNPDRTALIHRGQICSYGELEALANRLAHVFRDAGLTRGEHIAGLLPNGFDIFAVVWAAYRCGLYFTPIPNTLSATEAGYMARDCEARLAIAHAECSALAQSVPAHAPSVARWIAIGGPISGFEAGDALLAAARDTPIDDETPGALMLYTSGTTGAPKGVCRPLLPVDYRGIPPFARDLLELFNLGGADVRYLSPAPLHHAAPLRTSLAVTAGGGTVVVMDRFDAAQALDLLEGLRITHSQWVPTMFQRMLALPEERRRAFSAPAHRVVYHGAAPCPIPLKRAMIEWWGPILLEYYAGSEGVGVTTIDSQDWLRHPGSVGKARRGAIHILDEAMNELPRGATGRIYFSGSAPFAYFGAPDKTKGRISPQGYQTLGDVGRLDADGYLYLTDRTDDMIISGGVNLYPQEIENAIAEAPGVEDCGVVGMSDARFGETPVAFVVPTPAAAGDPEALREAIRSTLNARLGRLKHPSSIHVCAQLPRSATGKLLRRNLPELLAPSPGEGAQAPDPSALNPS